MGRPGLNRTHDTNAGNPFDFPFEDRRKLTRWSDVATGGPETGVVETEEQRREELMECLAYFTRLWQERQEQGLSNDFISMLAHGEATKDMSPEEYLGNLILLIVGGNDTTRNSMTGGVLALNENPGEYAKLRNNPGVIPNMVSEIIRWQTPLAHMRRIANRDYELGGQTIKQGDKVIMWYLSGNRDERAIENLTSLLLIESARANISPLDSARIAAWGTGWQSCSYEYFGKKSKSASTWSKWSERSSVCHRTLCMGTQKCR
ncbi:MAG: hypothetical protein CM15mP120_03780 [Pseudomonadota bacterium]|nr:MAG: hypothetical protein CM15mP120_03780 [Pseudomonadota bacterium]